VHPALDLIVSGTEAWTSAGTLAAAGHGPEALAALAAEGLIARWDLPAPHGRQWTLTPLAAYLLGVRLDGAPRWDPRPLNVTRRRACRSRCDRGYCRLRYPERVPDTAPGPEYLVDPVSERPVRLFGERAVLVVIDRRLRGKRGGRRAG
jgi:hypothetical protein